MPRRGLPFRDGAPICQTAATPAADGRITDMRLFTCTCGNTLFFDNTACTACGRRTGWCQSCAAVTALEPAGDHWICQGTKTGGACGARVALCRNYAQHDVCNRTVPAGHGAFCDCCRYNETVPDLTVPGNRARWARLEAAKRRLFHTLDQLGLPYGAEGEGVSPPLSFAFMGDRMAAQGLWRPVGEAERVYTGHADGLITINIAEADAAERESLRVDLGEAHRTLIGHFRHEIGHYYWDVLIKGRPEAEAEFAALFGDPQNPPYGEALERHYRDGPPPGWEGGYVSAYATMHPWEDWAETWALYLDIVSVLDTAANLGLIHPEPDAETDVMVRRYQTLGLVLNELNREMGLLDFVPEVITPAIAGKLAHVRATIARGPGATP
ncbi:zinc-binding metallopeptidase family protein [Pseudooceanicola aestuarii]|uniref:zinc-binding metallopeptidase family protein n=1 Tax=Pseudooceanicola aestuarii TaxID=2697319 RepID=UPI001954D1D8|nr:putative zinc-binding metallopeptidase [Pseudooceanicola aestuarii]